MSKDTNNSARRVPDAARWNMDPARALADLTARAVYGGRDRTEEEFRTLLRRCGFDLRRVIATGAATAGLESIPC